MTQVLNNLILNASKFSPQGSMIMELLNDGCKSMPLTRELELRPNKPKPYSIRSIESKPIQQKAFPLWSCPARGKNNRPTARRQHHS
jgi:hypothetical protein